MSALVYHPLDISLFKKKAQIWASSFCSACVFNSNNFSDSASRIELSIAAGHKALITTQGRSELFQLSDFIKQHAGQFLVGSVSYDFSSIFFLPQTLLHFKGQQVEIQSDLPLEPLIQEILAVSLPEEKPISLSGKLQATMSRAAYGEAFRRARQHIQQGDVYEINLCQEFYSHSELSSPFLLYQQLNRISPNPFSAYFKHQGRHILCASPERFLAKRGGKLFSQPIKGTAPRGLTPEQDKANSQRLRKNPKDVSENVMIVDLVRNDLTQVAAKGSVKVDELLGLYSFPLVHQLISTISCTLAPGTAFTEILERTFPPGSMTGAPKKRAMELIAELENSQRSFYSGSIGYISAEGDFDFNVVIRSLVYKESEKRLSYHVGGAITILSEEEEEYQECLLKAEGMQRALFPLSRR